MMRDNLNAARVASSAKAALEAQVQELKKELAAQSEARPASSSQEPQDQSASSVPGEQQRKPEKELENELESLQQTNKLLTDQIRTLQVGHSLARDRQNKPRQCKTGCTTEKQEAL